SPNSRATICPPSPPKLTPSPRLVPRRSPRWSGPISTTRRPTMMPPMCSADGRTRTDMKLIDTLCPIRGTGFAAGERLEPVYGLLWSAGARGVWASAPETRRQVEAGLGDLTGMSLIDEEEAISIITDPNNIVDLLPALGVIENMRTVTIEQL